MKLPFQAIFSQSKRYEFTYLTLRTIVEKLGFRLYNRSLIWHKDEAVQQMISSFPAYHKQALHERRFTLFQLAKAVQNIPGDTAECGSLEGEGSYVILNAINQPNKQHHIFDSFEGLSTPEAQDQLKNDKHYEWKQHDLSVGEKIVRKNLAKFANVSYWKGWIPNRFAEVAEKHFSLVHIDVDLYQPTKDSVEFFYDKMSPGGMMIFDDYGFATCPGAYKALNEFFQNKEESIIHLTVGTGFIIKK